MTTPTATGRTPVKLTDPAQLLAALPYLLGFLPENSVVLIGHRPPGTRIGLTLRADLPPRSKRRQQAEALAPRMAATPHTGVTVVVIGGRPNKGGPPHRGFVDRLEAALAAAGLRVLHSLWTPSIAAGQPWACYRDADCGGVLPDPKATVAAAAMTTEEGKVVFDSREEVEAQLQPRSPEAIARRSEQLNSLREPPWASADLVAAAAGEIRAALERQRRGMGPPTDEQAVRLACALTIKQVRDACLATAVPAGEQAARDAEALWLTLVRELPAPERAEAAALLAFAAFMRGDGTFAGMAVENALEADPNHVFADLLGSLMIRMVQPSRLAGLAAGWPGLEELDRYGGATPGSG